MDKQIKALIIESTGASSILKVEIVQDLWSGYGKIYRIKLNGSTKQSIVVKHVVFPNNMNHPRGWNNEISHQRKLKSYQVEMNWYRNYAPKCSSLASVPECFALENSKDEVLMIMEDLNQVGFPVRKTSLTWNEMVICVKWLANFHATFMQTSPIGLWETGTYWHLETRPDELKVLADKELKENAKAIDRQLKDCKYQTFVHGDAKLANFCFSNDGKKVAAVDFQYVGGGCGMKDLAYFVGSCFYEDDCERYEKQILDEYFLELRKALKSNNSSISIQELETEWRELYPVAWTDFHRFLKGWSPGHWKINCYSERITREVLAKI